MDLGTVKKNLKGSKYESVETVLNEIQLIWDNCHLYNAPDSVFLFQLYLFLVDLQDWN
jgi:hypothetical protein